MLSGGKTPLDTFRHLAQNPVPIIDKLHLLWSDERLVPRDSPESNFGNTQGLVTALGIPPEKLIAVSTDLPMEMAAQDYHDQIQAFLDHGGTLPLGLLGLGSDGHTASLFSVEDARRETGCWAIPVRRSTPPGRVSITRELLARFERLLFIVTGADKREILKRFRDEPETIPAGWAVREVNQVEVWCWLD